MFEKTLQDLVKGIRSNKHHGKASKFISQAIAECKEELRMSDPFIKANAIRKLTFLHMLGYDMSWAAFNVMEIMSQPRFCHKREGYLAATHAFTGEMDVLLLTTNLFKKEFLAPNQYEAALALNCVSNVVNGELARNLLGDVVSLTQHSRAYVRKKAVLSLFKLYVKYPQGLRITFDKLAERLEDDEPSVVSAAVNVICELANKNPRNYLAMAPQFFRLMTSSSNNWMLIKVVKLLGSLVSEEPRLARKLLEPLATIIRNTQAKSLQYECLHTLTLALPYTRRADGSDAKAAPAVVDLCCRSLQSFVEDADQNLKYLGLVGFVELMRSHPRSVMAHRELVLRCLNDDDVTIRTRALELLTGMVTRRSLVELVHRLLVHVGVAEGRYRSELVRKIIFMCSREKYSFLADFDWYVSVLVKLARLPGVPGAYTELIAAQLIDVCIRVADVRTLAVTEMAALLLDAEVMTDGRARPLAEVLRAAAFIVGEYHASVPADELLEGLPAGVAAGADFGFGFDSVVHRLLRVLMHPRALQLPPPVLRAFGAAAFKLFVTQARLASNVGAEGDEGSAAEALAEFKESVALVRSRVGVWLMAPDAEAQVRLTNVVVLLAALKLLPAPKPAASGIEAAAAAISGGANGGGGDDAFGIDMVSLGEGLSADAAPVLAPTPMQEALVGHLDAAVPKLRALLREPLLPVNVKAQRRVPVPEGLDLDEPFSAADKPIVGGAALGAVNFASAEIQSASPPRAAAAAAASGGQFYDSGDDDDLPDAWREQSSSGGAVASPLPGGGGGGGGNDADRSPFMLGSKSAGGGGGAPGIDFGDDDLTFGEEGKRRRQRKAKKDKKKKAGAPVIFKDDILPAGAMDDGGDGDPSPGDDALSSIDITKPVHADEMGALETPSYPSPETYSASAAAAAVATPSAYSNLGSVEKPRKKAKKKDKKNKKAKKVKGAEAEAAGAPDLLLDLVGLDPHATVTPPQAPSPNSTPQPDPNPTDLGPILGGVAEADTYTRMESLEATEEAPAPAPAAEDAKKKKKKKEKKAKKAKKSKKSAAESALF